MLESEPTGPTEAQRKCFVEVTGHPWPAGEIRGEFQTSRPFNDLDWQYSPWNVRFEFHSSSRHLYCELNHRMTNSRGYGWDAEGTPLPNAEVAEIYPSRLF